MERETNKHPVSSNPSGLGGVESRASTGLFDSHVPQSTGFVSNPCQTDTGTSQNEKLSHRKQKEPDKYDGEKVEWQDFRVHFETRTNLEKGLQLATCLRGKAQKVLSELKPSQKSDYHTLTSVLAKRFNPPHRENVFRAMLRQRRRLPKESLMDFAARYHALPIKRIPNFLTRP